MYYARHEDSMNKYTLPCENLVYWKDWYELIKQINHNCDKSREST